MDKKTESRLHTFEWVVVAAIFVTFLSIAIPTIQEYRYNVKLTVAISDIIQLEDNILNYKHSFNRLPPNLQILGFGKLKDPWGNPYQYRLISRKPVPSERIERRQAQFQLPLNDDYDLFSMGPDGKTAQSLLHPEGSDDIIRADNGTYIGLAGEY
jgi:general secretion pathway protein G